jgi:hypothetical protein
MLFVEMAFLAGDPKFPAFPFLELSRDITYWAGKKQKTAPLLSSLFF